ncbi:MAG: pyridoxal phosphate-dependent aminotransferase [Clostridia bacterium]|nr:pyridoxal phosphate-dependent aminotransferase [Clostridia bacterium]
MIAREAKDQVAKGSQIRKMFEEGKRLAAIYGAENVYDFSLGNPDQEPPAAVLEALKTEASSSVKGLHAYMANAGYAEARESVARYESTRSSAPVEARGVVMTVGAAGSLSIILRSLLNPGEEVILIKPFFTEYTQYVRLAGGVSVQVDCLEDFQPDFDALAAAITAQTKAIIINSPNNPSGAIYSADTLIRLQELLAAQDHTIYVISDEPYREIVYGDAVVPPVLRYLPNAIVAYSWSKSYALPGERIGYACCQSACADYEDLIQALVFYNRTLGFVNAPAIWQRVVTQNLDLPVDVSVYKRRRDRLLGILRDCGIECQTPAGAFYLFPKVPAGLSAAEFAARCAEQHILLVPATGFGMPDHVRLSYAVADSVIEGSEKAFHAVMEGLQ